MPDRSTRLSYTGEEIQKALDIVNELPAIIEEVFGGGASYYYSDAGIGTWDENE